MSEQTYTITQDNANDLWAFIDMALQMHQKHGAVSALYVVGERLERLREAMEANRG